jgi:hypothetical protein
MQRYFEVLPPNTSRPSSPRIRIHPSPSPLPSNPEVPPDAAAKSPELLDSSRLPEVEASYRAPRDPATVCGQLVGRGAETTPSHGAHGPTVERSPWLAHTRFLEVLPSTWDKGLAAFALLVAHQEPTLFFLYNTVKSTVRTWQNTTASVARFPRLRVMQEELHDTPLHPLEPYQNKSLQHALPLQKIFVFSYRILVCDRPPPRQLVMTPSQAEAWKRIVGYLDGQASVFPYVDVHHTRTRLDPLEKLCHSFWLSLVEHTYRKSEFEHPLIVATAFLVLSRGKNGLREVYNFATDITALKKMVRLASLQKFRDELGPSTLSLSIEDMNGSVTEEETTLLQREPLTTSVPVIDTETSNRAVADSFRTWAGNYLTTEYPTPMNSLIQTARFLSRFRYGGNLDAFVHWNGVTATLRGMRTTMSQFTSMAHNLHEDASSLLAN